MTDPTGLSETDLGYVREAIALAVAAVEERNRPFAAVLVAADGEVLVKARNVSVDTGDPMDHAELNIMRIGHLRHGPARLARATLYVNAQPCTMCAGTILRYDLARVIFGLRTQHVGPYMPGPPLVSLDSTRVFAIAGDRIKVTAGVLEDEARRPFELYKTKGQF